MAGYDHTSGMSNNAVSAYDQGKLPISRLNRTALRKVNFPGTVNFAKWLASEGYWTPCEWHHTSSRFNQTDFFDLEMLAEIAETFGLEKLQAEFKGSTAKPAAAGEVRVSGEYTVWEGRFRNHQSARKVAFTGVKRGNWIHVDGGGRKKADGNNISWSVAK